MINRRVINVHYYMVMTSLKILIKNKFREYVMIPSFKEFILNNGIFYFVFFKINTDLYMNTKIT